MATHEDLGIINAAGLARKLEHLYSLLPYWARDRRTIVGRIVPDLNGVALAITLGDCNRAKIPENSSFASIFA